MIRGMALLYAQSAQIGTAHTRLHYHFSTPLNATFPHFGVLRDMDPEQQVVEARLPAAGILG